MREGVNNILEKNPKIETTRCAHRAESYVFMGVCQSNVRAHLKQRKTVTHNSTNLMNILRLRNAVYFWVTHRSYIPAPILQAKQLFIV